MRKSKHSELARPMVVFGFDMETDIGSWTPFYEGLVNGTPRILDILDHHQAKATFFFTGEAALQYPEVGKTVATAGHEIGCHALYHETLGDELLPIPGLKPLLPEECFHRLEVATKVVQKALGKRPVSFRAPRLWGSTSMVNALEDLKYVADCSYPVFHYRKQLVPYHPSRRSWTNKGNMRILEIPNFADMVMKSSDPNGLDRNQWPLFRSEGAASLMGHVDNMLSFYKSKNLPAVICLYMHPWEFHKMPQGAIHYGEGAVIPDSVLVRNCGDVAVRELDRLITMFKERGATFWRAKDLAGKSGQSFK